MPGYTLSSLSSPSKEHLSNSTPPTRHRQPANSPDPQARRNQAALKSPIKGAKEAAEAAAAVRESVQVAAVQGGAAEEGAAAKAAGGLVSRGEHFVGPPNNSRPPTATAQPPLGH